MFFFSGKFSFLVSVDQLDEGADAVRDAIAQHVAAVLNEYNWPIDSIGLLWRFVNLSLLG